jgi:hypothetical protein
MLGWFREKSDALVATALLSLVALGAGIVAPHPSECHDIDCAGAFSSGAAAAHRIRASSTADEGHSQHCAVCHGSRSFRPSSQSARQLPVPSDRELRVSIQAFTAPPVFLAAQPPLRSPPSSLESAL